MSNRNWIFAYLVLGFLNLSFGTSRWGLISLFGEWWMQWVTFGQILIGALLVAGAANLALKGRESDG